MRRGDSEKRQKLGWFFPFVFTRRKDQDKARLKRGGYYEGKKQRGKGEQEGTADEPQREEKAEEGEEKQLGWNGKILRPANESSGVIHKKVGHALKFSARA